ncbi:hypothetical protein HCC47_04305 [Streptococcus suis]|nr:hypothetical protein [Streptococcus suis]
MAKNIISWSNFEAIHSNPRDTFEQLTRILFKRRFLDATSVLVSSPNHPGTEANPIYSHKLDRYIAFQSKFFQNGVDYSQIQKSVEKTIEKYSDSLDTFYLYCNKDLSLDSKSFKKIENNLNKYDIELVVISNNEILATVIDYPDLQPLFFGNQTVTKEWFREYNKLSFRSLGTRYNPKFNVVTGTDEKIQLFTKNQSAIDKINSKKSELISELDTFYYIRNEDIISKIKNCINSLKDITVDSIDECLEWNSKVNQALKSELEELAVMKENLETDRESDESLSKDERNRLYEKIREVDRLRDAIYFFGCSREECALITEKILVVNGEAGMGKTQLFATTTKEIMDNEGLALLLLGHHYSASNDISSQIMERLEFRGGFHKFLDTLDILGEVENKNIYILIDAINETPNRAVWKNGLAKILSEIEKRVHIKIILSVRAGYENLVFEENMNEKLQDGRILSVRHVGFQDKSIEATREFLNFHGIPFSTSDFLNYDMTNPLYLTLFCKTYNGEELNLFQMFERIIAKVDEEIQQVLEIPDSGAILMDLLLEIAQYQLQNKTNSISKTDLLRLNFWSDYGISKKPFFISNLVKSGLVIDYLSKDREVYSFGYNLLEDYLKAKVVMELYFDKEAIREYSEKELLKIENGEIQNGYNIDTFLFVCCFCFQKFGEDCINIIEKVNDRHDCYDLANRYIKSFSWRPVDTLSRELFRSIANHYPTDIDSVLRVLIENCSKEKSPLNAEFLHEILFTKKLSERDGFWLPFINQLAYEDERVYQLISLYDNGDRINGLSKEKTKLILTLFTWLLSSSNRKLRDVTSKAMIEILKYDFELSEFLLRKFEDVNDPYIIQRLYGVIFGASTKKVNLFDKEFQSLAVYVYLSVFDKEFIYPDILLRDYARLIIERCLFEFPDKETKINYSKIVPPYKSDPIPVVPTETYRNSESGSKIDGFERIDSSMRPEGVGIYGDFGRYTFQAALTQFENIDVENLYHYAMQFIRDELGYTSNKYLSEYDMRMHHPLDRSGGQSVERIGKKYQWIAFYNILARISDTHNLRKWDDEDTGFKGPWNPYVRDFDPTLNHHTLSPLHILPKFSIDYELEFLEQESNNNEEIDEWINQKPILFNMPLHYKDDNGIEWMLLHQHKEFKYKPDESEDNLLGYIEGEQRIWRIVEAYFIANSEFAGFIQNIQENKFLRNNLSGGAPSYYQFYNREYAWSSSVIEAYNIQYDYYVESGKQRIERQKSIDIKLSDDEFEIVEIEEDVVVNIKKKIAKLQPARIHFLWEEEYDLSKEKTVSFDIPSTKIVSKLNLTQKEHDGYYYDDNDLVIFDGELTGVINGLVIRKDYLDRFLKENELSIIWDFVGEKQYFTQTPREQYYSRWEGIFWEDKDSMRNQIYLDEQRTVKD